MGTYQCIQMCRGGVIGAPAFVMQSGDTVNLMTETGESYRAWLDWNAPASRLWIEVRDESAVYSPDGMRIQFDDGRVWQRVIVPPPAARRDGRPRTRGLLRQVRWKIGQVHRAVPGLLPWQ